MQKKIAKLAMLLLVISVIGNIVQLCYSKINKTNQAEFLSYQGFVDFFNDFNGNFKFNGYQNLYNNDTSQIIYIDSKSSFGKRNYLTLDNKQSDLQTQRRIEFVDASNSRLITIDFIYLDTPLYADLLFWNDPLPNGENEFLKNIYTDNILSYKNILIKIGVASSLDDGEESVNKILTDFTGYVTDYISRKSE